MPKVSVLYIADDIVGPHLQLLRNICDPLSKSRPHVTVRYFDKLPVPAEHLSSSVSFVDLVEPGAFGFDEELQTNRTVFIRCESDDLLHLEHKPNFPSSEFHITIYDGSSQIFAEKLLKVLKRFRWEIRLRLPVGTSLSEIELKKKRSPAAALARKYPPEIETLFFEITGETLTWERVKGLSSDQRLELANKVCLHLELRLSNVARLGRHRAQETTEVDLTEGDVLTEVHLTPPELAQSIVHCALSYFDNTQDINFGDPAVGTGAFFAALIKEVRPSEISSAIGIDINPQQVKAARWRWEGKGMTVLLGDYLHMENLAPRNLVLANPPYLRHQEISSVYKSELRQRASVQMGMRISGLSGQYVYFLLLAHQWMTRDAIAAWLIPSEFMQTGYGQAVREYLSERVQLLRIHRFGQDDPQFESAEVLPSAVFFRNASPAKNHIVELTSGGSLSQPLHSEHVLISEMNSHQKWSIPWQTTRKKAPNEVRLGDLFSVKRGIATGANDFFMLERESAKELGLPDEVLRPVLPKVRQLSGDVVERCSDGFPDVRTQFCLLDCALPIEAIEKLFPRLFSYLKLGEKLGVRDGHLVGKRSPWYRQEWRPVSRFLCTNIGRVVGDRSAIQFIWNKSDAVATNTYLMLYPHPAVAELLKQHPELEEKLFSSLKASARDSVPDISRTRAGGLRKVEPSELLEANLADLPDAIRDLATGSLL